MYVGCISGALQKDEYLRIIEQAGFVNKTDQKEKEIDVPDEVLLKVMDSKELNAFRKSGTGIFSSTAYAEKPDKKTGCCCCNC